MPNKDKTYHIERLLVNGTWKGEYQTGSHAVAESTAERLRWNYSDVVRIEIVYTQQA